MRRHARGLLITALLAWGGAPASAQGRAAQRPAPVVQSFVTAGLPPAAELKRLREALARVPGVVSVEVRPGPAAATILIKGDVLPTLFEAAAKPLGIRIRPTPVRFFEATGSKEASGLARLRAALRAAAAGERVALGLDQGRIAIRIHGLTPTRDLDTAARAAGYRLERVGAYVASGSYDPENLEKLRKTLSALPGVRRVEMARLIGGGTFLVRGDVSEEALANAARPRGYTLASIRNVPPREVEFNVVSKGPTPPDSARLREFALGLEGTETAEVRTGPDGPRLVLGGDRLKPDRIVAAAAEAGYELQVVESVTLPSLTPEAGRVTPAAFEDAVNEDPLEIGKPAPDFELLRADGRSRLRLSSSVGKRPVVLVFGSCT